MPPKEPQPISSGSKLWNDENIYLPVIAGLITAAILLFSVDLQAKWTVFLILGLFGFFTWISSANKKTFLFILLIIALPFNADYGFFGIDRPHVGGLPYFTVSVIDIITIAIFMLLVLENIPSKSFQLSRVRPLLFPILAIIVAAAFSFRNSESFALSSFEFFRLIKVLLTCVIVILYTDSSKKIQIACQCLVMAAMIEAGFALIQHATGMTSGLAVLGTNQELVVTHFGSTQAVRPGGTFLHANSLGMFLNLCFPIALACTLCAHRLRGKILFGLVSLIIFITIIDTLSRAAWLSLFVSVFVFFVFAYRELKTNRLICIMGTGALLASLILFQLTTGNLFQRIFGDDYGSGRVRPQLMIVAWNIIKENPWTGVGINNYSEVMLSYRPPSINYSDDQGLDNFIVHNLYLLFIAETGLIGTLGLIIFLVWIARRLYWGLRSQFGNSKVYLASIGAGITSFGVHSLFDNSYTTGNSLIYCFWFIIGLFTAASNASSGAWNVQKLGKK